MMGLVQSQLMSWPIGLSCASSGSPFLNPSSGRKDNPLLTQALHEEAQRRYTLFSKGVMRYLASEIPAPQSRADMILNPHDALKFHLYRSENPASLHRPVIFLLPSLVNRHYILDLSPEVSLARYLTSLGMEVILAEWPVPSPSDKDLTTADYVEMLMEHLQRHWDKINRPLLLVGYCMGGILATAVAQLFPRVKALALLATPWNFSHYPLAGMQEENQNLVKQWVEDTPLFPHEALQLLIYMANPYRLYLRFSRFAQEQDPEVIRQFVALEHWANDGVPITQSVAHEGLLAWPQHNTLLRGEWRVAGERIQPEKLNIPSFLAIPQQDYIVPPEASLPLAGILPDATVYRPCAGHVGMIAGGKRHLLWKELSGWITQQSYR
jgi:polyhydroxyalkanoate synthase